MVTKAKPRQRQHRQRHRQREYGEQAVVYPMPVFQWYVFTAITTVITVVLSVGVGALGYYVVRGASDSETLAEMASLTLTIWLSLSLINGYFDMRELQLISQAEACYHVEN